MITRRLQGVEIIIVPCEVGVTEIISGTFLGHIDAPIKSVQIKVVVAGTGVGLIEICLQVPAQDIAEECVFVAVVFIGIDAAHPLFERPTVVLGRAKIDFFKSIDTFISEEREI